MKILLYLYVVVVINALLYASPKNMINVGIANLDILEVMCWSTFVVLIYYLLAVKLKPLNKFNSLLSEKQLISFIIYVMLLLSSFVIGIINSNENLFSLSRGLFLFIIVFLIFFLLFNFSKKTEKYFRNLLFLFTAGAILVIISYFSPSFVGLWNELFGRSDTSDSFIRSVSGGWGAYSYSITAVTSFLYFIGLSNILFSKRTFVNYFITIIGLISTNIFFHKPVVVTFFIGNIIIFLMYLYIKRKLSSFLKIAKYILIFSITVYLVVLILPQNSIEKTIDYIMYGWLNIGRNGYENDLSTGRFTLWYQYGTYSLRGIGLAPWGIGKELSIAEHTNPHNFLIFLSYNTGVLSAIFLLYFLISIFHNMLTVLKKQLHLQSSPIYSISFAILAYLITLLIQGQYGATLDSIRPFIFFFSSLLAVLLHLRHKLLVSHHL